MSYKDGWAAIQLQKPARIPRTEYSVESHWELLQAVTGLPVSVDSPATLKERASLAFMAAWNYDFIWSTLISRDDFGEVYTDMGHAEYAAGGVDRSDTIFSPFKTVDEVLDFDPWEQLGSRDLGELTRRFEAHYARNCARIPDAVNMTGIYVTLISGLIYLFGWDWLLLALGTDPERFGKLCDRYAGWVQQYFDALAAARVPVVMIHDDIVWSAGPFMRPAWYRKFVFPHYRRYFAPLLESGKRIMFCSDGNFTQFVDDIAAAGAHGFVFEPLTDLAYVAGKYGQTHVIVGNADTRALLMGPKEAIRAEVERCMSIGRDCPGFFLAVGNHIPANTPVENCLYYNEVYEELSRR
ncbi:MAG: methylcobalamin:coenzyme M methyltransferase [Chloroflexi bacterium ADurb.Bin325]|nr:MAG: methylcobalamin:coenzyme M methyltransferase [Chloroflexi bacterium ADurb.Bin325]